MRLGALVSNQTLLVLVPERRDGAAADTLICNTSNSSGSISEIASIIHGSALGTTTTGDHCGIEAANADDVEIGTAAEPLTPGFAPIQLLGSGTNDVTLPELQAEASRARPGSRST